MCNIPTAPLANDISDKRESDLRLIAELLREDTSFRIFCTIESATTDHHHN